MSKKPSEISSAASVQQASDSVYDFLYHDARRVGAFLAQLDPHGHLQSLRQTKAAGKSRVDKDAATSNLGVPGVAKIEGVLTEEVGQQQSTGSDATYDPLWANARALLDHIAQRNLLVPDLYQADIGQLSVISGILKVINMSLLTDTWSVRDVASQLLGSKQGPQNVEGKVLAAALNGLPYGAQAHIFGRDEAGDMTGLAWMSLDEKCLVVSATDLMMKYGSNIAGRWHVLCIKDTNAEEEYPNLNKLGELLKGDLQKEARDMFTTPAALYAEALGQRVRGLTGRPSRFFGVTPILIFREVQARTTATTE